MKLTVTLFLLSILILITGCASGIGFGIGGAIGGPHGGTEVLVTEEGIHGTVVAGGNFTQ